MTGKDLSDEKMRIYHVYNLSGVLLYTHEILAPELLFWERGHSFHRIYDGKMVYLVPAPGILYDHGGSIVGYVAMAWEPKPDKDPVAF